MQSLPTHKQGGASLPQDKQPLTDELYDGLMKQANPDPYANKPMIYLASPHSHSVKKIREARFLAVSYFMGQLVDKGNIVFCPIAHSHTAAKMLGRRANEYDYWRQLDEFFLERCDLVMVYALPGWEESYGIAEECDKAKDLGKQIIVIAADYDNNDILIDTYMPPRVAEA